MLDMISPCIVPTLHTHQIDHEERVFQRLRRFHRAIDTSRTGSGKTHVTCSVAHRLGAEHMIVICPPAIESKWKKVVHPRASHVISYSKLSSRASVNGWFRYEKRTTKSVVNLDPMINSIQYKFVDNRDYLCAIPRPEKRYIFQRPKTLLVLDESQRVKNQSTQCSRATVAIAHEVLVAGGWVILLSATPFDELGHLPSLARLLFQGRPSTCIRLNFVRDLIQRIKDEASTDETYQEDEILHKLIGFDSSRKESFDSYLRRMVDTSNTHTSRILRRILHRSPSSVFHDIDLIMQPWIEELLQSLSNPKDMQPFLSDSLECGRSFLCSVLPHLTSMMTTPESQCSTRFDTVMYLEHADVASSAEQVWMEHLFRNIQCPKKKLRQCMMVHTHTPAPMSTPSGLCCVDTTMYKFTDPSWALGEKTPCIAWRKVVEAQTDERYKAEALAMYDLCTSAYLKQTVEYDELHTEHDPRHPLIDIEMIKARHLLPVVVHLFQKHPTLHVVTMFNYLHPMKWFYNTLVNVHGLDVCLISGDKQSFVSRNKTLDRFNDRSSSSRLLCCTVQTMKEGIDLHDTEGHAPRLTFIMAGYSAITMEQAKGRNHRTGSKTHSMNCIVYGDYSMGGEREMTLVSRIQGRRLVIESFMKEAPRKEDVFVQTADFLNVVDNVVEQKTATAIYEQMQRSTKSFHQRDDTTSDKLFKRITDQWLRHEANVRSRCLQNYDDIDLPRRVKLYLRESTRD